MAGRFAASVYLTRDSASAGGRSVVTSEGVHVAGTPGVGSKSEPMHKHFLHYSIPLAREDLDRIPRLPGFKWEYWDGCLQLSERMNVFHATLPVGRRDVRTELGQVRPLSATYEGVRVRPLEDRDWADLPELMRQAFCRTVPFSIIPWDAALTAAASLMAGCRAGEEGPLVREACFVAEAEEIDELGRGGPGLVSAVIVTRSLRRHLVAADYSEEPRVENPHLTWAMTRFWGARTGVASELLGHALNGLADLGERELDSTFMEGNHASTLWHWRNGFTLRPGRWSARAMNRRMDERAARDGA